MKKRNRKLNNAEIKKCANARTSAGKISQIVDGDFVDFHVPRLAGRYVTGPNGYKFATRAEAIEEAKKAREMFAAALI